MRNTQCCFRCLAHKCRRLSSDNRLVRLFLARRRPGHNSCATSDKTEYVDDRTAGADACHNAEREGKWVCVYICVYRPTNRLNVCRWQHAVARARSYCRIADTVVVVQVYYIYSTIYLYYSYIAFCLSFYIPALLQTLFQHILLEAASGGGMKGSARRDVECDCTHCNGNVLAFAR